MLALQSIHSTPRASWPSIGDAGQQGWMYRKELVVSGYAAILRVIVRDRATLATGSVSVPVHPFSMKKAK